MAEERVGEETIIIKLLYFSKSKKELKIKKTLKSQSIQYLELNNVGFKFGIHVLVIKKKQIDFFDFFSYLCYFWVSRSVNLMIK